MLLRSGDKQTVFDVRDLQAGEVYCFESLGVDRSKPAKFFRLSSNVLAEITNL